MIAGESAVAPPASGAPTLWGLTPTELHDRFWAARGVQVVRLGEASEIVEDAELFLLIAPRLLTMFRVRPLIDLLSWIKPDILSVRIQHHVDRGYRETAVTDGNNRFVRFERSYGGSDARLARAGMTPHRHIAEVWKSAADPREGWRRLRREIPPLRRTARPIEGRTYDRINDHEVMQFMRQLIQTWRRPDATIDRIRRRGTGIWLDRNAESSESIDFIGPSWIGAGRRLEAGSSVIGPAALWDDPSSRPTATTVEWDQLEPSQVFARPVQPRPPSASYATAKRIFDIAFASIALVLVLPLFPFILLAILLEDGPPFFFLHPRETRRGKIFSCIKFRSMYRNADEIKSKLGGQNEVDGPQFFIKDDPRLTKTGRILRKFHLDELPQLLNVLSGDMSIVGPRPSPYSENQFCPTWREARLSVPPGITGLWQVMRTRREGLDFQEWIRYDIEYVEQASLRLDFWIVWRTIIIVLKGT